MTNKEKVQLIDTEIHKHQEIMNSLIEQRDTYQKNLSSIKAKLSQEALPQKYYTKLMEARVEYKESLDLITLQQRKEKQKIKVLNDEKTLLMSDVGNEKAEEIKESLRDLKSKYFEFYRDKTRISYMRKMANDFIIEIDNIIKKH